MTEHDHDTTPDDGPDPKAADRTHTEPATSGHSEADSQAKRNQEDESPA